MLYLVFQLVHLDKLQMYGYSHINETTHQFLWQRLLLGKAHEYLVHLSPA